MRIGLLKMSEEGGEEVTSIASPDTNPDSPDFDYDAWLAEDEVADENYPDEKETQEEPIEENEEVSEELDGNTEETESSELKSEKDDETTEENAPESDPIENKVALKTSKGEFEHDLSDTELTTKMLQQGYDAQQKWQEAAAIRNQSYKFMEALKTDAKSILMNDQMMGEADFTKMCEEHLYEKIQEENMSPEEKALRAENRELKAAQRKKDLEVQQEAMKLQNDRLANQDSEIRENITTTGLPLNHETFLMAKDYLKQAEDAGIDNITPATVMDFVKRDYMAAQQEFVRGMNVEQLEELLGKELLDNVRKIKIKQAKVAPKPKEQPKPKKKKEPTQPKYRDLQSFLQGG